MDGKLSTYAEFSNPETAARAVRALKAAGFEDITTEDLSHPLGTTTDEGTPPAKKSKRYSKTGLFLGAIAGCLVGLIVFAGPVLVFNFPFAGVVALVGFLLCLGVGCVIGLEEGFRFSGRKVSAPTSVLSGHPVGVSVSTGRDGARLIRAREILGMYCEDVSLREKRWWQLRRWSHTLST